jgi:RNA polymerase sigma-B factor
MNEPGQHALIRQAKQPAGPAAGSNGDIAEAAEIRELFRSYRISGDRAVRNQLVQRYRYLAETTARRFAGRGEPWPDLLQVALLGLVKAVQRFDPDYGVIFPTFAVPTMVGELRRHFRDTTWPVHVPRHGQELHLALSVARERLTNDLGRSPTSAEVAAAMGVSIEDVLHAAEVGNAYRTSSIDPGYAVGDGGLHTSEARLAVQGALETLPRRERQIVHLRFVEGHTQAEIGHTLGLSQVHISRLLRSALEKMRTQLTSFAEIA